MFNNRADYMLAGRFDSQITEDMQVAKRLLVKAKRERPWC